MRHPPLRRGAAAYSYTQVNSYDALGRVTSQTQNLLNASGAWVPYTTTRTYNLTSQVIGQIYPSNRSVSYSYAISGRLSSFSGGIGDGVTRTYADTFSYNAAGLVTKERFGTTTALYHNLAYNNRLQLVENRLGTSSTDPNTWNRGALINYYSNQARTANNQWLSASDNNGNVTRVQHFVPTADVPDPVNNYAVPMIDDYDYDALNRITLVTGRQQASSGSGWSSVYGQGYSYDRWGNRTINQAATYGTAINNTVYAVDTTTNRLTAMTYDAAGSVITDSSNAREYDAENHMKKAWGSGQWNYYVYDADGKRVRRIVGATETWMVYGIEGELVAEYPVNGAAATPQKEYGYRNGQMLIVGGCDVARWIVADHLGTPRMEVDPSGSLSTMRRHDYLPFGEELLVGMGNGSIRTAGMGYTSDCVRQRFGSYERDNETGLDFAQARYYANVQGRFTSPDPLGGHLTDPQTLSKYTYVRNNPLRFTDSTGLDFYLDCNGNSDTCKNGRVGTTTVDANGKKTFTATQISNDKNGNLVDQNGNQYTGNFDEKGFHFSNAQGDSFSGSFADKTAATTLSGAGIFDGFTGVFNSNGLNTNVAQGTLFGTQDQFNQLLGKLNGPNPGLDKLNFFHPGTDQYRGGNRDGVDPHLSYDPNRTPDPRNRVGGDDRIGQGLHYDGAYPYGSPKGFAEHTYSAVKFLFQTKVMGRKEIPPPQTIPR